jgi:hypothetical protein
MSSSCKQTVSESHDSRSSKLVAGSQELEDVQQLDESDVDKGIPGGLSRRTMWEIAAQNTAAAAAYAKTVKADIEAAAMRGEEPEEPFPFQFTWPGKPFEDVYAHWLFTNLPVGGGKTLPSRPDCLPTSLGGPPTALHVQLVLELLLLCWPDPQVPYVASAGEEELSPLEFVAMRRWDWLLLMIALLQQTVTEQKQQFLRERGPLLMQLLYQVLLEDTGLGGAGMNELMMASGDEKWFAWYVTVKDMEVDHLLKDWMISYGASVPMLVTMVLQNLFFESLPESLVDPGTARIGKVLKGSLGKFGTWKSVGYLGGCA